jgi:hypothetical protein
MIASRRRRSKPVDLDARCPTARRPGRARGCPIGRSRNQPRHVSRKRRDGANIRCSNQLSNPALQTDGEPAVRRNPVPEGVHVRREPSGRLAAFRQGTHVVLLMVQPLAAGHDLHPAEEQVEPSGEARAIGIRMRVEGPLPHGIAGDDQELRSPFSNGPLAEPPFVGGSKVVLVRLGPLQSPRRWTLARRRSAAPGTSPGPVAASPRRSGWRARPPRPLRPCPRSRP